jgi:hypothetical protein
MPDSRRTLLSVLVTTCTQHTKSMYVEVILLVRSSEFVCTKTTVSNYVICGIASFTVKFLYLILIHIGLPWGAGLRYRLDVSGPESRYGLQTFHSFETSRSSLPTQPSVEWESAPLPPRVKREVKQLPRYSVEIRNERGCASSTWLHVVDRESFTFRRLSALYVLVYVELNSDMISFLKRDLSCKKVLNGVKQTKMVLQLQCFTRYRATKFGTL